MTTTETTASERLGALVDALRRPETPPSVRVVGLVESAVGASTLAERLPEDNLRLVKLAALALAFLEQVEDVIRDEDAFELTVNEARALEAVMASLETGRN